jgi:hypothetical protein
VSRWSWLLGFTTGASFTLSICGAFFARYTYRQGKKWKSQADEWEVLKQKWIELHGDYERLSKLSKLVDTEPPGWPSAKRFLRGEDLN